MRRASGCRFERGMRVHHPRRTVGALFLVAATAVVFAAACDNAIEPRSPKLGNQPPESFLLVQSDQVVQQLYRLPLVWLGSDPDGRVVGYRYRWVCLNTDAANCPAPDPGWTFTTETRLTFSVFVPNGTGRYEFQLAAVDDEGEADPTPASQVFELHNTPPVVSFRPATTPTRTLPA